MFQKTRSNYEIWLLMGLSFIGLFLVGMLVSYQPIIKENFPWRKPVIGSMFGLICVLGILAVFFPSRCLSVFNFKKEEKRRRFGVKESSDSRQDKFVFQEDSLVMQGHHPNCGNFSTHVFRIGKRTLCTSCTGLLLGALLSLPGTFLYFSDNWNIGQESLLLICVGILGITFGLLQFPLFKNRPNFLRFFFNVFFVLGAFFILIGVDALLHSATADLILVLLIVFWLFTRIFLSQWDHERICRSCGLVCNFVGQEFGQRLGRERTPIRIMTPRAITMSGHTSKVVGMYPACCRSQKSPTRTIMNPKNIPQYAPVLGPKHISSRSYLYRRGLSV